MNYVKLITESYFEVNTVTRFDFELKKELFQQALTRKQKVLEQKKHITEKEFLTQCGLALNEVRNHIVETLEFREHPRNSYIKNIKDNIFVDIQDIGGKSNRELSEAEFNELDKLFGFIAMLHHKTNQYQQPEPPQQTKTVNLDEVYKTQNLFKVGLLFATGKMNKFFTVTNKDKTVMKEGFSAPKIAEELENSSYNKYILASINNYTTDKENGNKNIFNSFDMMTKIIAHCKAENLPIDTYFESRLPIE